MSQNHRGGGPSDISTEMLFRRVKRICPDCGKEFDTIAPFGRSYCNSCAEGRIIEEERDRAAREAEEIARRHREMVRAASIPPRWRDTTFDASNPKVQPAAFKVVKRYAENFTVQSPSLVLYSPGNGTGKTHLAACLANHILHEKRVPVLFKKARDLMLEIRRTFSDRAENFTEADILDRVLSVALLVLDDVGVDPPTQWLHATYWTVFDRRLEWRLPIVITTNKPFEASAGEVSLGDRIGSGAVSRLVELCQGDVIDMTGVDLR